MLAAVHTAGINWQAVGVISGLVSLVVGLVGKGLAWKLDQVGDHLRRQDEAKEDLVQRVARIEGHLGMDPPSSIRRAS